MKNDCECRLNTVICLRKMNKHDFSGAFLLPESKYFYRIIDFKNIWNKLWSKGSVTAPSSWSLTSLVHTLLSWWVEQVLPFLYHFNLFIFPKGVFCNDEAAQSNRHRPGSKRTSDFLYGSHCLSPWWPPEGRRSGSLGDLSGEIKEWDHKTNSS